MTTTGFKESVDAAEEAMKLHRAFSDGLRAAITGTPSQYEPGTPERAEWERGYHNLKEAA